MNVYGVPFIMLLVYIHDVIHNQWTKIMNYEKPTTHFFI